MDELLDQFIIEGRDLVAQAHAALVILGREAQDRAAFDALFRAIHTLKGSVALFDMAPAEQLLHAAETRLETVRKTGRPLEETALDAVLAVIDQTDRWIDEMESTGSLGSEAAASGARLNALLDEEGDEQLPAASFDGDSPDWLARLRKRPAFAAIEHAKTAFRYTPDPDCFFRGEDPLAIAAAVPDLLALTILPADGVWRDISDWEPFRCMSVIEGASGADETAVRAAFRLVPDQMVVAPLAAVAPQPAEARVDEASATLRVEAITLDRLADQSGELSVAIRALRPIIDQLRALDPVLSAQLSAAENEITRVASAVQRSVTQVRLVPIEPVLRRLPRLAREAAATLGKPIRFTLEGEGIRVDKRMADLLFEPLLHLVRNAVDHGLEGADERAASGKPAEGHLHLSVRQEGSSIAIALADDGRGMDPSALRQAAVARDVMSQEAADALDDTEALRIIFMPGFSTAATASSLSGRGIGMDAVQVTVERLAGTIAIDSRPGEGTRFTLRLPAHAITTPLLVVGAGDRQMGIRFDQVIEIARIDADAIQSVGHGAACILRDATVPVLDLAVLLGLEPTRGDPARLVLTDAGGNRTALRVASLGERFDAVVREGAGLLASLPAVSGTALQADGRVLLVLDLPELLA